MLRGLFFIFFSTLLSFGQVINFAPLPTRPKEELLARHYPLLKYLEKKTNYKFEFVYIRDYDELLKALAEGKVQLISAGGLPYLKLKQIFPDAELVASFKNETGSNTYECVCFTSFHGPDNLKKVKGPIALTQRISVCGYFSANILLSSVKKDINKLEYKHFDSHKDVIHWVLSGKYEMGCAREDIIKSYKGYGLKVLGTTGPWPEFVIVANPQKLQRDKIEKIRKALLSIDPEEAKDLVEGKYGFAPAKDEDFEVIKKYEKYKQNF